MAFNLEQCIGSKEIAQVSLFFHSLPVRSMLHSVSLIIIYMAKDHFSWPFDGVVVNASLPQMARGLIWNMHLTIFMSSRHINSWLVSKKTFLQDLFFWLIMTFTASKICHEIKIKCAFFVNVVCCLVRITSMEWKKKELKFIWSWHQQ